MLAIFKLPILFKIFCKSIISGSLAAFVIIVSPFAKQAANIAFSVAPTLGKSKFIFSPVILSQVQVIFP